MIMRAVCDSRVSKRERAAKKKKKLAVRGRNRVIAVRFTSTPQLGSFMSAPLIATINVTTKCLLFDRFASVRRSYLSAGVSKRAIDRSVSRGNLVGNDKYSHCFLNCSIINAGPNIHSRRLYFYR